MQTQPAVSSAARVGRMFSLDPVAILTDDDLFHWCLRVAASNTIVADHERDITRTRQHAERNNNGRKFSSG